MYVTGPTSPTPPPYGGAARSTPPAAAPSTPTQAPGVPGSSLWDLLTPEERDFFAQLAATGPLSYSRTGTTTPAAPTGQRLDVRG